MAATMTAKLNTGSLIPMLGLGTYTNHKGHEGMPKTIYTAIKLGYRHIDCAKAYDNQADVAKGLAKALKEGLVKREDLWITSKLWNSEHGNARAAIEGTLKELGLEYLDEYLIHWPVTGNRGPVVRPPIRETWRQMEDLWRAGLAKNIGVSNFSVAKMKVLLSYAEVPPAVNQVEVHPYWRNQKIIDFCQQHNVHVTAYSPLGAPGSKDVVKQEETPSLLQEPAVVAAAEKLGKSPAQILIRWGLQHGTSVIPKATSEAHLKSNLEVLEWTLPNSDYDAISSIQFQRRLVDGTAQSLQFIGDDKPYRTISELWDGEV